jgi:hypothetical protein
MIFHDWLGERFLSFLHTVGYINVLLDEDVNLEFGLSLKKESPFEDVRGCAANGNCN